MAKRTGVSTGQREAEIHKVNTLNAIAVILDGWHIQSGMVNNNGAWEERYLKLSGLKQHVAIPCGGANAKIPTVVPPPVAVLPPWPPGNVTNTIYDHYSISMTVCHFVCNVPPSAKLFSCPLPIVYEGVV